MKSGIHPKYHEITVEMTDGTSYKTRSTWGKEGDVMRLDVDPKTHPAWVGGVHFKKTGAMEKFSNKYSFLGGPGGARNEEKKEEKKDESAA